MPSALPGVVAVIPARGGSTRIPRKNVRPLDGRPLIAWVLETARTSGVFDRIVVSTDDDEVAAIALSEGADVPFRRDPALSDDHTPLVPVVADTVTRLSLPDSTGVCCIYPTAIGLLPTDLVEARRSAADGLHGRYLVSVVRYSHPIQRALVRDVDGRLAMLDPEAALTRTQDLEPRWYDAGQFVWADASTWRAGTPVLTSAIGLELPGWRAVDLDTEDDWERADDVHRRIRRRALG